MTRRTVFLSLAFIGLLAAYVLYAVATERPSVSPHSVSDGSQIQLGTGGGPPGSDLTPPDIGLDLKSFVAGAEALASIERLHGKSIALVDGYIAEYSQGALRATIWLGRARTEGDAVRLFENMDAKMGDSGVFTPSEDRVVRDIPMKFTSGMGMSHYYFHLGKDVYWISLMGDDERALLETIVTSLQR